MTSSMTSLMTSLMTSPMTSCDIIGGIMSGKESSLAGDVLEVSHMFLLKEILKSKAQHVETKRSMYY